MMANLKPKLWNYGAIYPQRFSTTEPFPQPYFRAFYTFFFFFLTHYLHKKKKFNLKTYNSILLDIYGISVGEKLKKIV